MSYFATYQTAETGASTSNLVPEGAVPGVRINAQPGAVSVNADGTVTTQRSGSLNTASFAANGAGILATARTVTGAPAINGISGADIITVNGMELSVAMAEQMGMVSRDPGGRYVEVTGGVETAKANAELPVIETVDDAVAFPDAAEEAALADLCGGISPGLQVGALQDIITTGALDPLTINRAASEAGMHPGEMSARVAAVMKSFEEQAVSAVKGYGSEDPEAFFEWARAQQPNGFKAAMQTHGMERSTKGYEGLYREYVAGMADHDPESVLNAKFGGGITATKVDGHVLLNLPGFGQIPYRAAIRAGLIKVSGA